MQLDQVGRVHTWEIMMVSKKRGHDAWKKKNWSGVVGTWMELTGVESK